jgi:shikimate kinase/3-dehydroquinate synthase
MTMGHIFLYGPPASGKSTVGRILAKNLGLHYVDLDDKVKLAAGMDIPQVMAERGESGFRELETAEFERLRVDSDSVVSLGGGTLLRDENRSCAELGGEIICLDAGLDTLTQHLANDTTTRPLLEGDLPEKLSVLLAGRAVHYASFPTRIAVDGRTPEQIAWQIQVTLGRFYLRSMGAGYEAVVRSGGIDSLGILLRAHGLHKPIIVTDVNVAKLHADQVQDSLSRSKYEPGMISIPAGESAKTLDTITGLWRGFLEAGFDRRSTVVALGGGVVGDLAGFAAATFMRGMDWVVVPTTLLSMVDASLGGKTGFDLPEGKNLIGSFHPPRLVLADPRMLITLPDPELRSGLAEVVKHGIIADPDLFDLCARGFDFASNDLPQIVRHAMAVKIRIIEEDPYEKGTRAALNLGHTVGHAVESVSGYRLRHGEAVAIGMVAEARLAEYLSIAAKGLSTRIAGALSGLGLPTQIPKDLPKGKLIRAMQFDKKKAAGLVRFALPVEIGKVQVNVEVKDLELLFKEN